MSRPKNHKESLENLGVKVDPTLKKAIEDESKALRIAPGTYTRQLVILGWQCRHGAPVAQNPRERMLMDWFNELPIIEQETLLTITEALYKKHARKSAESLNSIPPIPTEHRLPIPPPGPVTASIREPKKGGRK
jgi:hypothetical protein